MTSIRTFNSYFPLVDNGIYMSKVVNMSTATAADG